jgi:hypothetical protein
MAGGSSEAADSSPAVTEDDFGVSVADVGLRLRCAPRIDGDAPVVIDISCRSRVGVVSGIGDFARRFLGVVEDGGGADSGDDLLVRAGD